MNWADLLMRVCGPSTPSAARTAGAGYGSSRPSTTLTRSPLFWLPSTRTRGPCRPPDLRHGTRNSRAPRPDPPAWSTARKKGALHLQTGLGTSTAASCEPKTTNRARATSRPSRTATPAMRSAFVAHVFGSPDHLCFSYTRAPRCRRRDRRRRSDLPIPPSYRCPNPIGRQIGWSRPRPAPWRNVRRRSRREELRDQEP